MEDSSVKTEQEKFWEGSFGDAYIDRNNNRELIAANIAMFAKILNNVSDAKEIKNVLEFGSNIGLNLKAIRTLLPYVECSAIEINHKAANILKNDPFFENKLCVYENAISEFEIQKKYNFVFTKGVLIHIRPDDLPDVYNKIYHASDKYICMVEYYNPTPVMITYRGNDNKLFKRDFAGEFMDLYTDISLIDYGFVWHKDNNFPCDDLTWFLMKKRQTQ